MVGYQSGARLIVPDAEGVVAQVRGHDASVAQHQAGVGTALPGTAGKKTGVRINRRCGREPGHHAAVGIQLIEDDLAVTPAGGGHEAAVRVNRDVAGGLAGWLWFPVRFQGKAAPAAVCLDFLALLGCRVHHRQLWVHGNERRRLRLRCRAQPFEASVLMLADSADALGAATAVRGVSSDPKDVAGCIVIGCAGGHGPILPRVGPIPVRQATD